MALIVVFTNKSNLAPVSDYNVGVFINDHQIYGGEVRGHRREDGWEVLLQQFVDGLRRHRTKIHRKGAKE